MPVIEVNHLTKEYRLGALQGLKQTLLNTGARLMGKTIPERPLFKALDDVSFSIEQGEVVGIIGHNGAGKSTLLKMLAKISTPTSGSVKVNGRIAPLIEVGAGFVPDFTGRENVYLNGSILGMSKKEIDKKFDEIVDFAEMAEFIDTPVKRYSSGMQVKLAFAVATCIESEILIVDEVLAVGDLAFQRKCFDRMEDLIKRQGKTVLIVGHNIRQIERISSRMITLERGKISIDGDPNTVATRYYERTNAKLLSQRQISPIGNARVESSGEIEIKSIAITPLPETTNSTSIQTHTQARVIVKFVSHAAHEGADFGVGFHTTDFVYISTAHTGHVLNITPGEHCIEVTIDDIPLMPGVYGIRAGFHDKSFRTLWYGENIINFVVNARDSGSRPVSQQSLIDIPVAWMLDKNTFTLRAHENQCPP